jgi:hypothetical protein
MYSNFLLKFKLATYNDYYLFIMVNIFNSSNSIMGDEPRTEKTVIIKNGG